MKINIFYVVETYKKKLIFRNEKIKKENKYYEFVKFYFK